MPVRSMKIAVVSNAAESLLRFRGPLLEMLVARGHQVYVLAPNYSDDERTALRAMGVRPGEIRVERTGQNPLSDFGTLRDLLRWFRRERPDVSLTYFIKPNIYGGLAAAIAGVPRRIAMVEGLGYLFTDTGRETVKKRLARMIAVMLLRNALQRAHRVLFLNPDDRSEFIGRGIVTPRRAMLLGGIGVDLDSYPETRVPVSPVTFLMIGRMLREKGLIEYVDAARQVRARHPGARCLLVGGLDTNPGGLSAAEVRALMADGAVDWLGEQDDVRSAIGASTVYVLPSYREGVPRSTQEAMAMGRAVVTTDVPGCRETVVAGKNGYMVPPRDPSRLADAMMRFCDDPDLAVRMGRESRVIAEARFDVVKVNERIYAALMGSDEEPASSPNQTVL